MLPHLSEIKIYQMWIKRTTEELSLEVHRTLVSGMSNLEEPHVNYKPRRVYNASHDLFVDISSAFANSMHFPRLSNLSLWGINLRHSSSLLLGKLEIFKLRKLSLLDCSCASEFMSLLSD